jgi:membrane protein DedA with SNARE-associated domain
MTILGWTINYISHVSYLAIFALMALGGAGFPIPEDVVLLVAGYLASPSVNVLSLWPTLIVCVIAIIVADNIGYRIGKHGGRHIKKVMPNWLLKTAKHYFKHHGAKTIFISRFLSGIRNIFPIAAGMTKMPWRKFFIYDSLGGIISVPIVVLVGYFFGSYLNEIVFFFKRTERLIAAIFIIVLLAVLLKKQIRKIKRNIFEHVKKYARIYK